MFANDEAGASVQQVGNKVITCCPPQKCNEQTVTHTNHIDTIIEKGSEIMHVSKKTRKAELQLRIAKLSTNAGVNARLIKKAERELRKLS